MNAIVQDRRGEIFPTDGLSNSMLTPKNNQNNTEEQLASFNATDVSLRRTGALKKSIM